MIGQYVQNYKVIAHLGEGGMGVVFKAVDNVLGREVALKMLHAAMTRQPQVLERFKKEAQVLARLLHPNIAVIYNFIEQDSQYYMVMEYVEGKNLDALARVHRLLPHTVIAAMFIQALEGLHHAHKKGIFHRDIKPSNLILTPEGTVKLMDFGIAKIAGEQRLTQVNRVIGTVEFMAPEIIEGKDPSVASDIYATGITMYELLSGRLPFESNSDFNLMQDILKKKPVHLNTLNPAVPAALSKLVMKALEKKPENRFTDARAFQQALVEIFPAYRNIDLSALAAETPVVYASAAAFTQISDTSGGSVARATRMEAPATIIQQIDQRVLRNKKLPYVLAGAGLLAFLAVFIFISLGKSKPVVAQQLVITQPDTLKKSVVPVYADNTGGGGIPQQVVVPPQVTDNKLVQVIDPLPQPVKTNKDARVKNKKVPEENEKISKEPVAEEKSREPDPPPVEKNIEKTTVYIEGKVEIALRMRETISSNSDDREQTVSFTVTRPVVYKGVTIVKEGATARGRIKIGRVLSTVDIIAVVAANGQEIALKERDHRKVKNLASEKDYTAILIKGTRLSL